MSGGKAAGGTGARGVMEQMVFELGMQGLVTSARWKVEGGGSSKPIEAGEGEREWCVRE